MVPISYQVVGEEDYALKIAIDDGGGYVIESGDYTSHPPRKGRLRAEQEQQLVNQARSLLETQSHLHPAYQSYLEQWGDWDNPWQD